MNPKIRSASFALLVLASALPVLAQQAPQGAQKPAVEVVALRLKAEPIKVIEELPGRVVAAEIAEIRPQVSGILTRRHFEEGTEVKQGQLLFQIDPALYQALLDRAKADLASAKANIEPLESRFRRFKDLVNIEAVSRQELDDIQGNLAQARAEVAVAQAALAQAQINLDYTRVVAPISGWIGSSKVTKGALVTANQAQALAVVTSLDPIYVDVAQDSDALMNLRRRFPNFDELDVRLTVGKGGEAYPHPGKLLFHELRVDQSTGSVVLRMRFPNPQRLLLPGLFARVRLHLTYPDAFWVPQRATTRQPDGGLSVWLVAPDGTAKTTAIKVERAVESQWLVTQGLSDGDVLITEGQMNLTPGVGVRPVFPKNKGEE